MTTVQLTPHIPPSTNVVPLDASRRVAHYEHERSKQPVVLQERQSEIWPPQINDLRALRDVLNELHSVSEDAAARIAGLTARQREIMEMVLTGEASKVIAWRLGISQRTVENHRAGIMKRTRSTSIPALAYLAVAARWNDAGKAFVKFLTRPALESAWNATELTRSEGGRDAAPSGSVVCPTVYIPAVWSHAIDSQASAHGNALNEN